MSNNNFSDDEFEYEVEENVEESVKKKETFSDDEFSYDLGEPVGEEINPVVKAEALPEKRSMFDFSNPQAERQARIKAMADKQGLEPRMTPKQILFGKEEDYENPTNTIEYNAGKKLVNRSNELLANGIQGLGRWIDEGSQLLGGTKDGEIKKGLYSLSKWVEQDKFITEDTHDTKSIKEAFRKGGIFDIDTIQQALNFSAETGIQSVADMAHMTANFPAYIISRGREFAETRMEEKGLKGQEPTNEDMLIGLAGGVVSSMLEKVGLKATTGDIIETLSKELIGKSYKEAMQIIAKEVGKGTLKEAGTEAIQEGVVEPTTERAGTGSVKPLVDVERGGFGMLAGGVTGGVMSGTTATGNEVYRHTDAGKKQAKEIAVSEILDAHDLEAPTIQEDVNRERTHGQMNEENRLFTQKQWEQQQAEQTDGYSNIDVPIIEEDEKEAIKEDVVDMIKNSTPEEREQVFLDVFNTLESMDPQEAIWAIEALESMVTEDEFRQLENLIIEKENSEQIETEETKLSHSETNELQGLEELEAEGTLTDEGRWRMEDLQMKRDGIEQNPTEETEPAQIEPEAVEPIQEPEAEEKQPIEEATIGNSPTVQKEGKKTDDATLYEDISQHSLFGTVLNNSRELYAKDTYSERKGGSSGSWIDPTTGLITRAGNKGDKNMNAGANLTKGDVAKIDKIITAKKKEVIKKITNNSEILNSDIVIMKQLIEKGC